MFKEYRKKEITQIRPYSKGEILSELISISETDRSEGSPKEGDMIARNPANHADQWLVAKDYFELNYEKA